MSTDCLFCKIVAGAIPSTAVYRDEHSYAFRDITPQAPTHILIVPVRHLASVAEAQAGDELLLGTLLRLAAQLANQAGLTNGYRLVLNTGADGGQSVPHLHVHLLGGRALGWPPG